MFQLARGVTVLKSSRPAMKYRCGRTAGITSAILGGTRFVEDFTCSQRQHIGRGEMTRGRSYPEYLIPMFHAGLKRDKTLNTVGELI